MEFYVQGKFRGTDITIPVPEDRTVDEQVTLLQEVLSLLANNRRDNIPDAREQYETFKRSIEIVKVP